MGSFGLLDFGPSSQEKKGYNQLSAASNFGVGLGEADATQASQWMSDLISGDPTKVSRALAPQISAIQNRTQQAKDTTAQFSPRSGGTAAATADLGRNARADITNLTGHETGQAVSGLASLGANLYSTGTSGLNASFDAARNMHNDTIAEIMALIKAAAGAAGGAA